MDILWDINNTCNLKCKHCGAADCMDLVTLPKDSEIDIVLSNIGKIATSVTLVGGEPLLHTKIDYILARLSQQNIQISIITNGQFDPAIIDTILKHNIANITVSIEGNEAINDQIRGVGSWRKATRFLEGLVKRVQHHPHLEIAVATVINRINRNDIISWLEYLQRYPLAYIQLSPLYETGRAAENCNMLSLTENELVDTCEDISLYLHSNSVNNVRLPIGNAAVISFLNLKYGLSFTNEKYECNAFLGSAYCDYSGVLHPCRTVSEPSVSLVTPQQWNTVFREKFSILHKLYSGDTPCNTFCFAASKCGVCPLVDKHITPLCKEVFDRLDRSFPRTTKLRLIEPSCLYMVDNQYYAIFQHSGSIIEYSAEGFSILKELDHGWNSLNNILDNSNLPRQVVFHFLLQEILEGRIRFEKEE